MQHPGRHPTGVNPEPASGEGAANKRGRAPAPVECGHRTGAYSSPNTAPASHFSACLPCYALIPSGAGILHPLSRPWSRGEAGERFSCLTYVSLVYHG